MTSGVYPSLSREAYDAVKAWNLSRLRIIGKSAKQFRHALQFGTRDSAARKLGRVDHLAVLEPEVFEDRIAAWDERDEDGSLKRRAGNAYKAWAAKNAGKELITADERNAAIGIANALNEDPDAAPLLCGGQSEVSIFWTLNGDNLKCRLDYLTRTHIVELKKTRCADPAVFPWDAEKFGYHVQAAWQVDGFWQATGEWRKFALIAVEDCPPYESKVYFYTEAELAEGRSAYVRLLQRLDLCERTGTWPGYEPAGPVRLTLPRASRTAESEAA